MKIKPSTLADKLGHIRAQIADLEQQEAEIRDKLVETGDSEIEGRLFRVTVARYETRLIDFKGLIDRLHPAAKILSQYTVFVPRVAVSVSARSITPRRKPIDGRRKSQPRKPKSKHKTRQ
jgi:hypothetical protein